MNGIGILGTLTKLLFTDLHTFLGPAVGEAGHRHAVSRPLAAADLPEDVLILDRLAKQQGRFEAEHVGRRAPCAGFAEGPLGVARIAAHQQGTCQRDPVPGPGAGAGTVGGLAVFVLACKRGERIERSPQVLLAGQVRQDPLLPPRLPFDRLAAFHIQPIDEQRRVFWPVLVATMFECGFRKDADGLKIAVRARLQGRWRCSGRERRRDENLSLVGVYRIAGAQLADDTGTDVRAADTHREVASDLLGYALGRPFVQLRRVCVVGVIPAAGNDVQSRAPGQPAEPSAVPLCRKETIS